MSLWLFYLVQMAVFAGFALSLNLLLGYAGQLSAGHAGFAALGGYTVAYLATAQEWAFLPALAAGAAVAGLAGLLIGLPALRLSGEYLILLTIAFTLALLGVIATFPELGGTLGITDLSGLAIFGWHLDDQADWLVVALAVAALTFALCRRLGESPFGRVLRALREDPEATRAHGKNVYAAKLTVFAITSALAGLVGGVSTASLSLASPGLYALDLSMTVIAMVILGGAGNLWGAVLGGALLTLIQPLLRQVLGLDSAQSALAQSAVYGTLIVAVMLLRPQGLLPERGARGGKAAPTTQPPPAGRAPAETDPADQALRRAAWEEAQVVLRTSGVGKRFRGITAAEGLDLELREGTITALIGPNGAGKTTVFNLLTGAIAPDAGSVELAGRDLVGRRPDEIAGLGLVRTFQDVRLPQRLTCLENVMLGVQEQAGEHVTRLFTPGSGVARREAEVRAKAREWLEFVGMAEFADVPAGALSYGQSKLVSLARALATEARVLLLDEPASGIDTAWVERMLELIEDVRRQGRTVCIVEHNLHVVSRLADDVYFMELGRITAHGTVAELTASPRLAEAYFGTV
ncbi:branched-chain amino acid ABC transporter ATP-binding protein/permease [Actinocorallia sp. A-T 12471]|uniref:branched-chain amino acid ABC transporter ATP-binding protein/permease n=1 Tax=Actinocorallia sp. A-T 12471 TaxID=3089813 RepID=UPI0029CACFEC|nr:branched-chain amino acid ABC transporter ATP-binding protein/permease [Actinocorallia sp. A-T 12471]MDX6739649.1 branched-chain amino acid ABC transporter ATP-binding protein/permease [Actinocorallia sp. A-T 12471]